MKTKLSIALAIAVIAPFGLVACGDDDEGSSESDTTEATSETSGEDSGGGNGGAGGASTVAIAAAEDGSLAYEQESVEAEAGSVTIDFDNPSSTPHDVQVEGPEGDDLGGTEVITEATTSTSLELESGDYTFYCSVSGHREAGMEGDLIVE